MSRLIAIFGAVAIVALLVVTSAVAGRLYLPDLTTQPAPVSSAPPTFVVVGKSLESLGGDQGAYCVRFSGMGRSDKVCGRPATMRLAIQGDCYNAAIIGEPLPEVCLR